MQRVALPSATKAPSSRISRNSRVPISARPCGVRAASVGIEKEDYIDTVPDSLLRAGIDDQNSMKGKFERVRRRIRRGPPPPPGSIGFVFQRRGSRRPRCSVRKLRVSERVMRGSGSM